MEISTTIPPSGTPPSGTPPRRASRRKPRPAAMVGWKEWVMLPDIEGQIVHAKIDTGARTSALHVDAMRFVTRDNVEWVEFGFRKAPRGAARSDDRYFPFRARYAGLRKVKSSSGHVEERPVIRTRLTLAGITSMVDITLTSRERMEFPMLVGRSALRKFYTVSPGRAYLGGHDLQSIERKA